jgi:hypothetical protein
LGFLDRWRGPEDFRRDALALGLNSNAKLIHG